MFLSLTWYQEHMPKIIELYVKHRRNNIKVRASYQMHSRKITLNRNNFL